MAVTDSRAIAKRVADRAAAAGQAERSALVKCLSTPEGRRVWLWIRDVVLLADRVRGNWAATQAMDQRLVEFPELRISLAQDRAALEADQAAHDADIARLQAEERARSSTTGVTNG